ncbi:hypothetical protein ScPMuIL_001544 [Solemya velum]
MVGNYLLLIITFISPFVTYTDQCGGITHIEISHRAAHNFRSLSPLVNFSGLIWKHQDAFVAGSPYPDSFYSDVCWKGLYHDVSEDTHWAPFVNATVNYIRKHFLQPWDEATEKLVVFMLGFVSHQTSDILWHSLGIKQGFLQTMSKVNFHGSFPDAHTVGDLGGEVLNAFEMDLGYIDVVEQWYVPVDDLFHIYEEFYGKTRIQKDVIIECSTLMYLERLGVKIALGKLFPYTANKSPFLVEELSNFFLGGMDDMAGWTQRIWNEVIIMLEKGTEYCNIPGNGNTLFLQCNKSSLPIKMETTYREKNWFFINPQLNGVGTEHVSIKKALRGVQIAPRTEMKEKIKQMELFKTMGRSCLSTADNIKTRTPDFNYTVNEPYSKVGWSLIVGDLNNDGYDDLAVGAPGYGEDGSPQQGRVFITYGSLDGLPKDKTDMNSADQILKGPIGMQSRFGSSLAILDINLDGFNDLAVGAPSMTYSMLGYNGEVWVYLADPVTGKVTAPNVTLNCQVQYCNFGWTLATGDVSGDRHDDLLIGSPFAPSQGEQMGMLVAINADRLFSVHSVRKMKNLTWNLHGSQNYSWFAHNVYVKNAGSQKLMFVSQPTFRKCFLNDCTVSVNDTQSVGRLNIYHIGTGIPELCSQWTGDSEFEQTGFSSDIGRPYGDEPIIMAISNPGLSIKGKVLDIPAKLSQTGSVTLINITAWNNTQLAVFQGDRQYGRFGEHVKFADLNMDGFEDLIITAPLRTDDFTEELMGAQQGLVYIYYGGKNFPLGDATSNCSRSPVEPCPGEKASVVLKLDEDKARFGSNISVLKAKNKINLVITAAHSSRGARLSGDIVVYSFPFV